MDVQTSISLLVTGGSNGTVCFWDLNTMTILESTPVIL